MFHWPLGADLAAGPGNESRLRYTIRLIRQRQAAVKLHGVFAFRWTVLDCALVSQFHRLPGGDSRALVGPSCKSPIKRQGITLTSVAFRDLPIREAGRDFSRPPHVAMGVGLYLHRLAAVSGVQSLRILVAEEFRLRFIDRESLAISRIPAIDK